MTRTVSVVVPAFNNARYIDETIRSILSQTYRDIEVIVADHGSVDDTWERLQSYADDPRVSLLQTEPGGGARRNWNRVTEAATGEFVKLVCGDDLIHPEIVSRQVAAFDDDTVLVSTTRDVVDAALQPIVRDWGLQGLVGRRSGEEVIRRTVRAGRNLLGEPACVMFRRAALVDAGLWADEEYLIDEATYVEVLRRGSFTGIPGPLASFRVNAGQWSVRLAREQAAQARRYHRRILQIPTSPVHRRDVLVGDALATAAALARRLTYARLRRRIAGADA